MPRRSSHHLELGARGEHVAARYLRRHKHRIIARNYRCAAGEIDIVSADGDTIVFVEVKTRSSDEVQDPAETVRPQKWARVEKAARYFLAQRSCPRHPARFDLMTVVWPSRGSPQIEHFEDAHQPTRG